MSAALLSLYLQASLRAEEEAQWIGTLYVEAEERHYYYDDHPDRVSGTRKVDWQVILRLREGSAALSVWGSQGKLLGRFAQLYDDGSTWKATVTGTVVVGSDHTITCTGSESGSLREGDLQKYACGWISLGFRPPLFAASRLEGCRSRAWPRTGKCSWPGAGSGCRTVSFRQHDLATGGGEGGVDRFRLSRTAWGEGAVFLGTRQGRVRAPGLPRT
ncbi:MAG TPA: hypothetical protein VNO81_12175 [Candidatus Nitrosotenuis sp.]|jgi:hypothetical protein|nr:hypothetical protein [Candidatus Nitrosotenuis sp.]